MNAAEIMTRSVVTVPPVASVLDAIRLMLDQRISGLPVVNENGLLVGIVTEGDLLRRAELGTERHPLKWLAFLKSAAHQAGEYVQVHGRRVESVMTRDVVGGTEDSPLDEIVTLMEGKRIRRVPIVNGGRLVGIVSRADLLRALALDLEKVRPVASTDADLRSQIVAEMRRQTWGGRHQVTVIVANGVAYLEGYVFDTRERDAMRVVAENVSGITAVRDHLDDIDPTLGVIYGV